MNCNLDFLADGEMLDIDSLKEELLDVFLKGGVPLCYWDATEDFETAQGLLTTSPTEIQDICQKYEDVIQEYTLDEILCGLWDKIPEGTNYCSVFDVGKDCSMIFKKNTDISSSIDSMIRLASNYIETELSCSGIIQDNKGRQDLINSFESSVYTGIFWDNTSKYFHLKYTGASYEDYWLIHKWCLVSEDNLNSYNLVNNKNGGYENE